MQCNKCIKGFYDFSVFSFRSPRRQELLAQLGVTFERIVTGIEEQRQPQESAQQYVTRLAREKAQAGVAKVTQNLPVLGQILLSFSTEKYWKNRATLHTQAQCYANYQGRLTR